MLTLIPVDKYVRSGRKLLSTDSDLSLSLHGRRHVHVVEFWRQSAVTQERSRVLSGLTTGVIRGITAGLTHLWGPTFTICTLHHTPNL